MPILIGIVTGQSVTYVPYLCGNKRDIGGSKAKNLNLNAWTRQTCANMLSKQSLKQKLLVSNTLSLTHIKRANIAENTIQTKGILHQGLNIANMYNLYVEQMAENG